jgi:hypothetical protein
VYCCGCLIYWFFASGELQPWAKVKADDEDEIDEKKNNEIKSKEAEAGKF